jgi:hypothetical protein
MRRSVLTAALLALALTACGTTEAQAPAAPSATAPATPPADGGSYSSPRDIVAKLTATGITCDDYAPIAGAQGARDRGTCQDGNLVVSIYDREGDVQAQVEFHREMGLGVHLLTGRNWTVNLDDEGVLRTAQSVLGGQLVIEPA